MMILCLECDKYADRGETYYIAIHDATDRDIKFLGLRGRLNPELNYYATRLDEKMTDAEILLLFKQKKAP